MIPSWGTFGGGLEHIWPSTAPQTMSVLLWIQRETVIRSQGLAGGHVVIQFNTRCEHRYLQLGSADGLAQVTWSEWCLTLVMHFVSVWLKYISRYLTKTKEKRMSVFIWEEEDEEGRWRLQTSELSEGASHSGPTLFKLIRKQWDVAALSLRRSGRRTWKLSEGLTAAALTADESLKQFPLRFMDVKTRWARGRRRVVTSYLVKPKVNLSCRTKSISR